VGHTRVQFAFPPLRSSLEVCVDCILPSISTQITTYILVFVASYSELTVPIGDRVTTIYLLLHLILRHEVLMSHVSSHFREIAIGTHTLWTSIHMSPMSSVEALATYMMILPHSGRSHELAIDTTRESSEHPTIRCFLEPGAPILERHSILVGEVDDADTATINNNPQLLKGGAPFLSFVRLRSLALPLFKPPLNMVITLHLDQSLAFRFIIPHFANWSPLPPSSSTSQYMGT
jgi:hypothetical protein